MLNRYSPLTMHNMVVCKVIPEAEQLYTQLSIMPYHHIVIDNELAFVYIWDTRLIEKVIPATCLRQEDLTYAVIDNRLDLICKEDGDHGLYKLCYENRENMPILFTREPLTDDERAFLDVNHY